MASLRDLTLAELICLESDEAYRAEYERLMAEADAVIYELKSGVPLKNRLNRGRVDDIDLAAWCEEES